MYIDWDDHDLETNENERLIQVIEAPGFPPPRHEAEADLFARHEGVPGHDQEKLTNARVVMVGAGGLGSWVGLALVRSGIRNLTIIDPDRFDRTNAPRQLMFGGDIGRRKAVALAENLTPHMVAGGTITSLATSFDRAIRAYPIPADVLVVLVDNNACRLQAVRVARRERIPAVFSMVSLDGVRVNTFLQSRDSNGACLWCALPNMDPERSAPCASATITGCLLAAAQSSFFVHTALSSDTGQQPPLNWRTADLFGREPESQALVARRVGCEVCSQ